jgi:hypothetical protein
MFLKIDDNLTVEEVEDRFNECFPFLKIAFYSFPHKIFEPSDKSFRFQGRERIGNIRKKHFNSVYEIKSWFPVSKVEKELYEIFGLNAQILRSDRNGIFTQTTFSDDLSLRDQIDLSGQPAGLDYTTPLQAV